MIIGTPAYHIDDDTTDQIGIRTLVVSLLWQPTRWPMPIEELDAEEPAPPATPGGVAYIRRQRRPEGGALRTVWTFEGVMGDGKSPTFKGRGASPDFGFQGGFATIPIERSPKFPALFSANAGQIVDGQVFFPQFLPASGGSGSQSSSSQPKTNPMFGHLDFFSVNGIYTYRYAALSVQGLGGLVGKIVSNPPGQAPQYQGRNWLAAPLAFRHRGTIFDVQEPYWLSDEGGWPAVIYGNGSGSASSGAGGSVLGNVIFPSGVNL